MSDGIKILKIAKQGKKYRVETSEGEHLLTEDTLIKFLVRKDASYSEAEFKEILKHDEENRLFERVLRYLAQQSRSENEVREYLSKHGEGEAAEKIILRLKALNYLDNRLFAQNLFNYAVNNFRGPRYLEARLQKSGVAIEITKEVLERYGEELEKELISEILKKNKEKAKEKPARKQKELMFQKLLRAGFSYGAVQSCLRDAEFIDESARLLPEKVRRLEDKFSGLSESKKREKILRRLLGEGYSYEEVMLHLKSE